MGCASSVEVHGNELILRNAEIEKQLEMDRRREGRITKLLLLGGQESGKSTFAKQMRILHMSGFTESDYLNYRFLIQDNAVAAMATLLIAMETLNISIVNDDNQATAEFLLNLYKRHELKALEVTSEMGDMIERLWSDGGVQAAYDLRHEFQLLDSAKYFLDNVSRITQANYRPTEQDILMSRMPTTGIYELEFVYNNVKFRLIDVGGQRSERRKWIHCFDGVTAVLFLVALSEYDQVCTEDSRTKRILESIHIFQSVITNPVFMETAFVLFLNKLDLFKEKLKRSPLQQWFPKYQGINFEDALEFIKHQFLRTAPDPSSISCHYTVATDTNNINIIFKECAKAILHANLNQAGLE